MLYYDLFGDKKVLSQKPKQTVINLILDFHLMVGKRFKMLLCIVLEILRMQNIE